MSIVLQIIMLALYVFLLVLFGRFVMSWVLAYGRRWRPGRGAAASLELIWSVTDPPIKALRRVIPSARLGGVAVDVSTLVLLLILYVLMSFVLPGLITAVSN